MYLKNAYVLFKEQYIAIRGLSCDTEENYDLAVLSFTRACGEVLLSDITPQTILTWRRWMEKRNKQGTVRGYLSKMKNILIFTNKKGLSSFDVTEIYLPKVPQPLPEYLSTDELTSLINAADTIRDKAMLSFFSTSGIRAGELSKLNRTDVTGNQVFIRQGKCNTSRMIFIDKSTQILVGEYLRVRLDKLPMLFLSRKLTRLNTATINRIVKNTAVKAQLNKPIHTHMLRHSFATNMILSGCDISFVQKFLGHAFVSTTQIYVHLTGVELEKAYNKFQSAL